MCSLPIKKTFNPPPPKRTHKKVLSTATISGGVIIVPRSKTNTFFFLSILWLFFFFSLLLSYYSFSFVSPESVIKRFEQRDHAVDSRGVAEYLRALVVTNAITEYLPDEETGKPSSLPTLVSSPFFFSPSPFSILSCCMCVTTLGLMFQLSCFCIWLFLDSLSLIGCILSCLNLASHGFKI